MRRWPAKTGFFAAACLAALWASRAEPKPAPRAAAELERPARVLARSRLAQVGEPYRVHAVRGEPVRVEFLDGSGRDARVIVARGELEYLRVPFRITENECGGDRGVTCELKLPLRRHRLRLAWTAHPEAARVGRTVVDAARGAPVLEYEIQAGIGMRSGWPALVGELPSESVRCDDDRWLPSAIAQADELKVRSWRTRTDARGGAELGELSRDLTLQRLIDGERRVKRGEDEAAPKHGALGLAEEVEMEIATGADAGCRVQGSIEEARRERGLPAGWRPALGELRAIETDYLYESDEALTAGGVANLEAMLYELSDAESAGGRVPRDLE